MGLGDRGGPTGKFEKCLLPVPFHWRVHSFWPRRAARGAAAGSAGWSVSPLVRRMAPSGGHSPILRPAVGRVLVLFPAGRVEPLGGMEKCHLPVPIYGWRARDKKVLTKVFVWDVASERPRRLGSTPGELPCKTGGQRITMRMDLYA